MSFALLSFALLSYKRIDPGFGGFVLPLVLRRLDFIARVARDRCVPFGDMQVVFAGEVFDFHLSPTQKMIDGFAFVLLCGLS